MKTIKINAYEFKDLKGNSKYKALTWLDEYPYDYENGDLDEQGKPIKKYDYISNWDDDAIIEHCEINQYLFDMYGNPIEVKASDLLHIMHNRWEECMKNWHAEYQELNKKR
jgi:hypothetical protein